MGDMSDLLIDQMERWDVLVRNNETGEEKVVSGTEIMYTNIYVEPKWTILDENYQYD